MAELVPPSGVVHWFGAGMSTGSGLAAVCDTAERVVLWSRTTARAGQALDRLGLSGRAERAAHTPGALAERLRPGDVVVSMLPATEHAGLVRTCVDAGAHFACTSYVSPELADLAGAAADAGTAVLVEAGLDPGIDHVYAHRLVELASEALGPAVDTVRFTSYCGGIPADPNDFRYLFSWAPLGVLNALRSPARYVEGGEERTVRYPWEATRELSVGGEVFEVYPNRDSIPFIEQYRFPHGWQVDGFVRGTLRLSGWHAAWQRVFETIRAGDDNAVADLATELAARYPATDVDRDRVVLAVSLAASGGGRTWSGRYHLDLVGDDEESAMARCVSQPLAFGVGLALSGDLPPGLTRAGEAPHGPQPWLDHLTAVGLDGELHIGD